MAYEIVKGAGKTMWLIEAAAGEGYMRFYSKREAQAWIDRALKSEAKDAEFEVYRRARRLENAHEYLARRAVRTARPVQLELF
jgi:hypothetical protein